MCTHFCADVSQSVRSARAQLSASDHFSCTSRKTKHPSPRRLACDENPPGTTVRRQDHGTPFKRACTTTRVDCLLSECHLEKLGLRIAVHLPSSQQDLFTLQIELETKRTMDSPSQPPKLSWTNTNHQNPTKLSVATLKSMEYFDMHTRNTSISIQIAQHWTHFLCVCSLTPRDPKKVAWLRTLAFGPRSVLQKCIENCVVKCMYTFAAARLARTSIHRWRDLLPPIQLMPPLQTFFLPPRMGVHCDLREREKGERGAARNVSRVVVVCSHGRFTEMHVTIGTLMASTWSWVLAPTGQPPREMPRPAVFQNLTGFLRTPSAAPPAAYEVP